MIENPVVLLIAAMDTKSEPANYLRDTIESQGVNVMLLDPGIRGEPDDRIDITRHQVAEAAGTSLQAVRDLGHEGDAIATMARGTVKMTKELQEQGRIHGVISLGGSMGTVVATAAMRELPIGFPKVMISTIASGYTRPFVGSSDIMMLHSIADVAGLNSILRKVLHSGGTAVAGMAKAEPPVVAYDKPLVVVSNLGITEQGCTFVRQRLEEHGFEVTVFHANGSGGPNMDEVIRDGGVAAVLDMALIEILDHLGGGLFDTGPDRGRAAVETGTPTVIATGCIDVYAAGPLEDAKKRFPGRRYHQHNDAITAVRTDESDLKRVAEHLGKIYNDARGPFKIFVPLGGFSSHDSTEGHLYEPDLPPIFAKDLREAIDDHIPIEALPYHINDEAFAIAIADAVIEIAKK